MGRHGKRRSIVCVECGARAELSVPQAKRALWELWPGGGRCRSCRAKTDVSLAPLPDVNVEIPIERVIVRCTGCDRELVASNEFADGWRPNLHWLTTEENKKALRERRVPLPLCPGRERAGVLVRVEVFRPDERGEDGAQLTGSWVPRETIGGP